MTDFLPGQGDLLGGPTPLDGIQVEMWHSCRCGNHILTICGGQSGPHVAMLKCPKCLRNAGWLSKEAASFITETVKHFGRPTKPVVVRTRT